MANKVITDILITAVRSTGKVYYKYRLLSVNSVVRDGGGGFVHLL